MILLAGTDRNAISAELRFEAASLFLKNVPEIK